MSEFIKYPHLERFGTDEVDAINIGTCYVFPQLLGMTFHDLVTEELWEAIKKHKNPKIDFKTLHHFTVKRIKEVKREVFGG